MYRHKSAGVCYMLAVQFEVNNGTSHVYNGDIDECGNIISPKSVLKIK